MPGRKMTVHAAEGKLDSGLVPQAAVIERIPVLLEMVRDGVPLTAHALRVDERQVDYYSMAARLLGFLTDDNKLAPAGKALLALDERARWSRMALAFEASACGKAWMAHYRVKSLPELDLRSAWRFLLDGTDLGAGTAKYRRTTLRRWWQKLAPRHPAVYSDGVPRARPQRAEALGHTAVFDTAQSGKVVQALGPGTGLLRVATAYLSINGYEILVDPLSEASMRLLVGSESTFASVDEILARFRETLTTGPPSSPKRHAAVDLYRSTAIGRVKIRSIDPRYKPHLHAKVYLFDDFASYVTSSNLSRSGLRSNVECGYVVRERPAVDYYIRRFDELWESARDLAPSVLRALEESWVFDSLTTPYLLYLRTLLELFPRVDDLSSCTERRLAAFQELIVGAVLHALREGRGCLLVSPTGTGKTVMATYAAAVMLQKREARRVYVICPNERLKGMWEDEFHRFGLAARVITQGIIQGKGKPAEGVQRRIARALAGVRETDLVIVDECHAFRNEETNGFENLLHFLGERDASATPRLLLLSATPMSRGLGDLNALLRLLATHPLQVIGDLAQCRSIVNVTLPFIIRHFGESERGGEKTGLRFDDHLRHFAKIAVRTKSYTSPSEAAFEHITKMRFRFRRAADGGLQMSLLSPDMEFPDAAMAPSGFLQLTLMRRTESCPRAARRTIERLLDPPEDWTLEPEDPDAFRASLVELLGLLPPETADTKLDALVDILRARPAGQRVLIFSLWTATVEYLAEVLRTRLPGDRVEAITGDMPSKLRGQTIQRFAPTAQGRPKRRRNDDVDILVATDAIAEGENLQDAEMVVNYDLPWTPLFLVQRVGRVDRPTKHQREIQLWNFYPGAEAFERQVKLWKRLGDRSDLYDRMARTRVVGEHDRDLGRFDDRDLGLVRDFYEGATDLDRLRTEYLPTSAYLLDRANAKPEEMEAARSLAVGVRSSKAGEVAGTFVLLRLDGELHSVFEPVDGDLESAPDQRICPPDRTPRSARISLPDAAASW